MEIYKVGGCVRDELLGKEPNDIDYVVVGSTPDEMLNLGYKQVGTSFPVFLHPETGDEYALARTEKSTGNKYQDFDCYFGADVTLEDDLYRRDLTINAIAKDSSGVYIDPYQGMVDLNNKTLRHVSDAFGDDPVRLLRLARFNATLGSKWSIHRDTNTLCLDMLEDLAFDGLTPERVWKEIEKVLSTNIPSIFFDVLFGYGIFNPLERMSFIQQNLVHHPEGDVLTHTMLTIDYAAKTYNDPEITFACLLHDLGKFESMQKYGNAHCHELEGIQPINQFCVDYKVPNNYRDLALLVCKHHTKIHGVMSRGANDWTTPKSIMNLFQETNALVKPDRFAKILKCCVADARGRGKGEAQIQEFENKPYPQKEYLLECLKATESVNTKEISKKMLSEGKSGVMIGEQIRVQRINAIRGIRNKWRNSC